MVVLILSGATGKWPLLTLVIADGPPINPFGVQKARLGRRALQDVLQSNGTAFNLWSGFLCRGRVFRSLRLCARGSDSAPCSSPSYPLPLSTRSPGRKASPLFS